MPSTGKQRRVQRARCSMHGKEEEKSVWIRKAVKDKIVLDLQPAISIE